MAKRRRARTYEGLAVAEGVAIGKAKIIDTAHTPAHVPHYEIGKDDVDREITRFKDACAEARAVLLDQADQLQERLGRREGDFIRAQALMIDDPAFLSEVEELIADERMNAEAAVARVMERFENMVASLDDQYLRERSTDIRDASRRILGQLLFVDGGMAQHLPEPVVVIAGHLVPSLTVNLERAKILAFAAEHGGYTSHAAILARSLSIPAVTGLPGLTDDVMDGETVIVDGTRGLVIVGPTRAQKAAYAETARELADRREGLTAQSCELAVTRDGVRVVAMANVGRPEEMGPAAEHGAEGIGLYRTEVDYLTHSVLPSEDTLAERYSQATERFAQEGVVFRVLDIGGDKFPPSVPLAHEENPFIGLRGLRLLLKHQEDLMLPQLRAILRASAKGKVSVMYPMVASVTDLDAALDVFEQARTQVLEAGHAVGEEVSQGIMIEVPSAVPMLQEMLERVDFGSVGTNDLVQYLLAADRNSDRMAEAYDPYHPAVIRTLSAIHHAARKAGKPVSVCGEAASDPAYLPLLVGLGYRTLSVNVGAVPSVKRTVRALTASECRRLAQEALHARTAADIHQAAKAFLDACLE
jgi:phosphotransferase system enzyme I (PtsI)